MTTSTSIADLDRFVPSIALDWDEIAHREQWLEVDASLCFIDISGFTNLSERLARKGRIGAEELTDVLNYVFGRMLEVSYLQGGSLLKFGGDALLLMFTGFEHSLRAASAAVEMRSVLKEAEDYETSVGRLRLRMSVGIHSGSIDLFRAEGSHRELVVAGPGATMTTAMEKIAEAGEIVISDETKARLPDGSAPQGKGGGWILNWRKPRCDPIDSVVRQPSDPESVDRWVSAALRDYLQAVAPEPEHRIATVGFIRFCGVDGALSATGPKETSLQIDRTISVIQAAADEEGVTFLASDINEDGGKVILVAGLPRSREDDEGRLLKAMRRIAESSAPLDLHFGINQGHVFAGEIGTKYRATYTIIGDTVNLAARLAAAASANTIYATAGVLDNSAVLFESEPIEPFYVKGKSDPVHAYSVGKETGQRKADADGELPFVGRNPELSMVTDAIFETSEGRGTVLTIVGDTGMGKTRLVREACLVCSMIRVISIRSESYGTSSPYRPLRDVFRKLLEIERDENPAMAKALRDRVGALDAGLLPFLPFIGDLTHIDVEPTDTVEAIEPRFRRDRLADTAIRLLEHLLTAPTFFDLEDAQWMDDASAHLMGRIAGATESHPWSMIVSRRGREGGFMPADGKVLELHGLKPEDSRDLVNEATAAAPLRPHEVEAIVTKSGGNPLFLEEILAVVRDTGSVENLPESLGSVVSTGIDSLPPLARRILRYCSVLGSSFRTKVVGEILEEDDLELDAATRRALRRFLVADGPGRVRFASPMIRDVAYDALPYRRRRELHLRAAKVFERASDDPDGSADLLSLHYSVGGDDAKTWHYARVAGDQAAAAYANVEAASHYERALDSARHLEQVPDGEKALVWSALGDARELSGNFDLALAAYRRATTLASAELLEVGRLAEKRARVRERSGRYSLALRELTGGHRKLESVDSEEAARVKARLSSFAASIRQAQQKPRDAIKQAWRAVDEAEAAGEWAALARAYTVLDLGYRWSGQPEKAVYAQRALAIYEELGDLNGQGVVQGNMGVEAYFDGRWNDAIDHYRASRDAFRRTGNEIQAVTAESAMGEVMVNQGRIQEAKPLLDNARRVSLASDWLDGASFVEMQLARILAAEGHDEEAVQLYEKARRQFMELGETTSIAELVVYLATCHLEAGRAEQAIAALDEAESVVGKDSAVHSAGIMRVRGLALAEVGRLEEGLAAIDAGLEVAEQQGIRYELGLLLMAKSRLARAAGEPSESLATRGLEILEELGVDHHPELLSTV